MSAKNRGIATVRRFPVFIRVIAVSRSSPMTSPWPSTRASEKRYAASITCVDHIIPFEDGGAMFDIN
jgi:hypothetical protein